MTSKPRGCGRPDLDVHTPDEFSRFIPQEQWAAFRRAIQAVRDAGASFALGGGLAISFYTGLWRNTKDLDLYILPGDRERVIRAITGTGLRDYFDEHGYDRSWIYRGHQGDVIVDVIWALANGIADVDGEWLECGACVGIGGETLPLVAPEEMFWSKVHVVQRDRCDWPDLLNLLFTVGPQLEWQRLLRRMAAEEPLLASVLLMFSWLAPGRARELPSWLWARLGLRAPEPDGPQRDQRRTELLDSRPWFTPVSVG